MEGCGWVLTLEPQDYGSEGQEGSQINFIELVLDVSWMVNVIPTL